MIEVLLIVVVVVALAAVVLTGASVRVLREYERGVVFRLGRVIDPRARAWPCSCPARTGWCG